MIEISVIIPTFNRVDLLSRAIDSVMSQTLPANEIIVVDDGSSENMERLLSEKYPTVVYVRQENKGVSSARNQGVRKSGNEWLAFLDDDDEWLPHKLEKQVQLLQSHPDAVLCHTEERWIRQGVRVNQMNKHRKSGGWIYQKCLPLCAISPSSVLLRKSIFEEVGFFREDLPACEDYDMWLKICSRYPVLFVEQACLNKYGGHQDQLSTKHWGMDRFRIDALSSMLSSNNLSDEDDRATRNMLQKKIRVYIKGAQKRNKKNDIQIYEKILLKFGLEK